MLEHLTRKQFIKRIVKEKSKIIREYMKDNDITLKRATNDVWEICYALSLGTPLHLEVNNYPRKLKEFNNQLGVRLGYYNIIGNPSKEELEKLCEQCQLIPTDKGRKIGEEYQKAP